MQASQAQKEEWAAGVQTFMSSRLRTPPYAAASRAHPLISVPSMVANTQYILDGVVWSVNDHPEWAPEAWLYVRNFLMDAAERVEETVAQLNAALALRQRQEGEGGPVSSSSKVEREQMYTAHAAVQDLYLAFCVVDALLKSRPRAAPVAEGRERPAAGADGLRGTMEKELPQLVGDYFPVFAAYPSENAFIADAVEEYRLLFLAMLESWVALRVLEPHTIRRLEEHVRYKLKQTREALAERAGGDGGRGGAAGMQQGLDILFRGALQTDGSGSPLPGGGGSSGGGGKRGGHRAPRTAEMADHGIRSFLSSIFPSQRYAGTRIRCPHCGAPFKDEPSRDAHYRVHFLNHNAMRVEDRVVRLSYPTQDDFVAHIGDVDQKGYYPKTTELLEVTYKNGETGIAAVRRGDAPAPVAEGGE